jgi:hypothetical protein
MLPGVGCARGAADEYGASVPPWAATLGAAPAPGGVACRARAMPQQRGSAAKISLCRRIWQLIIIQGDQSSDEVDGSIAVGRTEVKASSSFLKKRTKKPLSVTISNELPRARLPDLALSIRFRGRRFVLRCQGAPHPTGRPTWNKGENMIQFSAALGIAIAVAAAGTAVSNGPTGRVVPNMHLANGQTVKVSGAGFSPNETVYIVECNKTARKSGEAACNLDNLGAATSNAKGRVPATKFKVATGDIGNGKCGMTKADEKCYIVITNASQTEIALVKILFKVR